jgi:HEAT repeat protein
VTKTRTNRARTYFASCVALGALGAGSFAAWQHFRPQHAAKQAQASASSESAQPGSATAYSTTSSGMARQGGWARGVTYRYDADYNSLLEGNKNEPDGSLTLAGSAVLSLTVREADKQKVVLQGELSEVSLVSDTPQDEPRHIEDSVGKEMARPFVLTLTAAGAVDSLGVEPEVRGLGYNILRILVSTLQFVEPAGPAPDLSAWVSDESDQNGRYNAHYRQLSPGEFQKTKEYTFLEITQKLQLGGKAAKPTLIAEGTIVHRQPGPPQRAEIKESITVPMGDGKGFHAESHITIAFKEANSEPVAAIDAKKLVVNPLFETRGLDTSKAEAEQEKELLGHATFEQLISDLEALPPTDENRDARWHVTRRMTALFNADPASVEVAALKLRRDLKPGDGQMLLAALSDARVPQAQAALSRVAQDNAAPAEVREQAVTHLGLLEHPTNETFSALDKMAKDPDPDKRMAATLALGGAVRRGAEDGKSSEAAEQSTSDLVQSFKGATTPAEQTLYLEALGNSGRPQSLDAIKAGLSSSDPGVRAAAVSALRFVNGEEAEALIAQAMVGDADSHVRMAAARTLSVRPLSAMLLGAMSKVAHTDTDTDVRFALVSVLGEVLGQFPQCAELLTWIAGNDPDADVKGAAARALAGAARN